MKMNMEALGVDIGNVIINHRLVDKNDKILFEERYSTIPAVESVFEVLKVLNEKKFRGNIFLVSKCTLWAEEKILAWLKDNHFYEKTGVKPKNIYFCRERQEKEKICSKLGVTHFIDDRLEVLSHIIGKVPNLYLFQPDQAEVDKYKEFLPEVIMVESWAEILRLI